MSVDPNGKTFWFTTEYVKSNTHGTRVVAFEFPQSCTPPDTQASNFSVDAITDSSMDISWTRGTGDRVLVVAWEGSLVNDDPVSGTSYTADAQFGNGDQIGTGNFVVYDGTGSSVQVTGLNPGTTYYFAIYEYAQNETCYLIPGLSGNGTTQGPPSVETLSMLSIGATDATGQGNVISDNGASVTERGLCWGTSLNPDLSGNFVVAGSGTGTFSATISGLTPNTTYYVRAYAKNTYGTSYGDNVSFRTACSLIKDFPYLESFNDWQESNPGSSCTADGSVSFSNCWENINDDDADWDIISGATPSSQTGPYFDANDQWGRYIYLEASGCTSKTASVTTPSFDLTQLANPELRFSYYMFGTDMGDLKLYASTDGGSTWSSPLVTISGNQGVGWKEQIVDLSSYSSYSNVMFKFTGITGSSYLSDIAIDNFLIQEVSGFDSNSGYCSSGGNMDYATAITKVIFNEINVSSGKVAPFNDYSQIFATVKRGQNYDLSVQVNTDGNYRVYAKAWIDWNADGDFDDSGEEYDLGDARNTSDGPTSNSPFTIQVPTNAVIGKTRMRISAKYNASPNVCETGFDGETEEYGIIIFDNCTSVAVWNGNLWKTPVGDTLSLNNLNDKFLFADNLLYVKNDNINACSLANRKGNSVVVDEEKYINLIYDLYNPAYFELRDKASLVQSDNNGQINGNGLFVMNKITDTLDHYYDYVYWSNVLQGSTTLGDIVPNAWKYYEFDAQIQNPSVVPNAGWVEKQATDLMQTGVGYAISAPNNINSEPLHVKFSKDGVPYNNGSISVPVYILGSGASDDNDWNLLGNPYPSALDFDQFSQDNTIIQGSVYLWTNCAGLNAYGQHQESGYSVYNLTGAISACSGSGPTASQYIASGQGFMVEANTSGNVVFSNNQRTPNNSNFINRLVNDRAWFDFANDDESIYGQILIGFHPSATDQTDRLFDAHAIMDRFFVKKQSEKFSIYTIPQWDGNQRIIPVGFTAETTGQYHIALNRSEGIIQNLHIYLIDYQQNIMTDLNQSTYYFSASAGLHTDRFAIVFSDHALKNIHEVKSNTIRILTLPDGQYIIQSDREGLNEILVYDLTGKLIMQKYPAGKYMVNIDLKNISAQVIMLIIKTEDGKVINKKVIR